MIQGELADRAFGSSYCYTQFKLVHLTLSFSSLTSAAWTYTGLWLQAYVLCTVIDAKYMNWDNRNVTPLNYESASNYYTKNPMRDGSEYSENWYELTRKGHVWDIPFIIIGPLMFASLMIALSLRQEIHELVVGALLVMPKWEEFQLCETRLQRAGWLIGRGLAYDLVRRQFDALAHHGLVLRRELLAAIDGGRQKGSHRCRLELQREARARFAAHPPSEI